MKKLLVVSAVAVLGLSSAFAGGLPEEMPVAPVAAVSNDTGVYLGLQGGFGMTHWKNLENTMEGKLKSVHKDNGIVSRVFAGYDINRYFAIESGYSYFFNKVNFDAVNKAGKVVKTGDTKTMAFDLMGKGKLPVVDSFDLYAKLGVNYLMTRTNKTDDKASKNTNNFNLAYGVGADYSITPNIIANVEWLRLNGNAKLNDKYQPNVDAFLIGLRYKFDL